MRPHGLVRWSCLALLALVPAAGADEYGQAPGESERSAGGVGSALRVDMPGRLPAEQRGRLFRRVVVEMLDQGIVGLSAAFIVDGEVAEIAHFGWQDREQRLRTSDATRYRWGTMSESIVAVATMQLVASEAIDLDAPVHGHVPEFPAKPWPVTTRQLLAHQGGLGPGSVPEGPGSDGTGPAWDPASTLVRFADEPLAYEPGTRSVPSIRGVVLLGAIVQRAGGRSFDDQVQERIAVPLGLTTLQPDPLVDTAHRATVYQRREDGETVGVEHPDAAGGFPGVGYLSNTTDAARFAAGLLSDRLVTDETKAEMWTAQATADGTDTGRGLGFQVVSGRPGRVAQAGTEPGATVLMLFDVRASEAIVLMCNTGGVQLEPLAHELLDAIVTDPAERAAP